MKKLLLSMDGRIPRSQFWLAMLVYVGLSVVLSIVGYMLSMLIPGTVDENGNWSVSGVAALPYVVLVFGYLAFCVWSGICVNAKRCHDRNRSGWFMLIQLIPFVGIWYIIEAGFLRGTQGPNRFGADPLDPLLSASPLAVAA